MAAALAVEMTISMVSRLAPMLPVQLIGVPAEDDDKLCGADRQPGGLAAMDRAALFEALLDAAGKLLVMHG